MQGDPGEPPAGCSRGIWGCWGYRSSSDPWTPLIMDMLRLMIITMDMVRLMIMIIITHLSLSPWWAISCLARVPGEEREVRITWDRKR